MPDVSAQDYALLQWIKQQNSQNPYASQNDWVNNIQPDGSLAGAQVSAGPRPQSQPKPSSGQQAGQATGNVAGVATGHAAANSLVGGSSAAPSAPTVLSGTPVTTSYGTTPGAFTSGGASAGSSGYPATEALLQGGSQEGIAQGTSAAGSGAPAWGSGAFASYGIPAAAAGATVWGVNSAYNNYQDAESKGTKDSFTSNNDDPWDAGKIFATGGLSLYGDAAGAILGGWKTGKDKDQLSRDAVRKMLKKNGFVNDNYEIELPGGNKFNIGKDGGEPWYNVDFTNPQAGGVVAAVQPLATIFAKGDKKLTNDFAGYLANAAMSGGDPMQNVLAMMEKTGMNHDQIYGAVHLLSKSQGGTLDDNLADAYKNALDQTYGVGAYQGQGSRFGTPPSNMAIPAGQMHGQEQMPGYKPRPQQQQGGEQESAPTQTTTTTPPAGQAGQAQQPTKPRGPFTVVGGQSNNGPFIAGKQRVSPGVWQDQKGQYLSKSGVRGK